MSCSPSRAPRNFAQKHECATHLKRYDLAEGKKERLVAHIVRIVDGIVASNVVLTRRTQVIELVRTVAVLVRIAGCARGDVAYALLVDEQKANF